MATIPTPDYHAATIISKANGCTFPQALLDRPLLVRVMYYPDTRYSLYLRAAQLHHPAYGGDQATFDRVLQAKKFLDFWNATGEDNLEWVSSGMSKTSA